MNKSTRLSFTRQACFALLFILGTMLGRVLTFADNGGALTIWLHAGFYLGFMILAPRRQRPAYAVTALLAWVATSIFQGHGLQYIDVFRWGCNTVAIFFGAWLIERESQAAPQEQLSYRNLIVFLGVGALLVPGVTALLLGLGNEAIGIRDFTIPAWRRAFAAGGLGVVAVTPLVFAADRWVEEYRHGLRRFDWRELARDALNIVLIVAIAFEIYGEGYLPTDLRRSFMIYPVLIWTALRGRPGVTATANLFVTLIAIYHSSHGRGPFVSPRLQPFEVASTVQLYMVVVTLSHSILALAVAGRARATDALAQQSNKLELLNKEMSAEVEKRRGAEERLGLAVSATNLGVWESFARRGTFEWSPKTYEIFGMDPSEPVSHTVFYSRVHPEDKQRVVAALSRARDPEGDGSYKDEYRIVWPDRSIHWVRVNAQASFEGQGEERAVERFVGTVEDITSEVRTREELIQANEAAVGANQAKSRFLANMSHEIRSPLGAIIGFADLLLDDQIKDEERREYVGIIKRNGTHLSELIDQILDLSKVESGRVELENRPIAVREMLDDVIMLLTLKAREKGVALDLDVSARTPKIVMSDPLRLKQILINGVGNAVKFTEKGGVTVRVDAVPAGGRWRLEVEIEDTGIGMTEEQRERLFQPFSQADGSMARRYGGSGLGLALSRRLARLLGGDFELIKTERNQGSLFKMTVDGGPMQAEARGGAAAYDDGSWRGAESISDVNHALDGVRVLVADDAPDNRLLVSRYLRLSGADVDCVSNGREAVDRALRDKYDVVLMDVQMPELDGFEAMARLKAKTYDRPIVALTAHAMPEEVASCLRAGFNGHVGKPVDRDHLVATVKAAVEHALH